MVQNAGEEKKIFVFVEGKKGEVFYLPVRHGKQHINFSGFDHRIDKASNTVLIFDSSFFRDKPTVKRSIRVYNLELVLTKPMSNQPVRACMKTPARLGLKAKHVCPQ